METRPSAAHETQYSVMFALQRLALEVKNTEVPPIPFFVRAGPLGAYTEETHGWVLTPARAPEGRYETRPIPGYILTESGKLLPFLPTATYDSSVVIGGAVDPANIDELWLESHADALLGHWDQGQGYWNQGQEVPGHITRSDYPTWGFDYQTADAPFPSS